MEYKVKKGGERKTMTKEMDEKETIQQVVYNEILYLPLKNMGIKDGARIKRIIKGGKRLL